MRASSGFFKVDSAGSGVTELVAAKGAGRKIRVTQIFLVSAGTVNVKFQSGTTDLTGAIPLIANAGFAPGEAPGGHFETDVNKALNLNLSGAIQVSGWGRYEIVK